MRLTIEYHNFEGKKKKKVIVMQKERDDPTIINGDINMSVSEMDISGREKISKGIVELKTQSIKYNWHL